MSFSRNRRAHRPVIEPINTSNANFPNRCPRFSRRRSGPHVGVSPTRINPFDSVLSGLGSAKDEMNPSARQMIRTLSVSESISDASGLTTPFGTFWTISKQLCPTPVSDVSPCTQVLPFVLEARSIGGQQPSAGRSNVFLSNTAESFHMSYATNLPASRRQSVPSYGAAHRYMQLQQIQRQRLALWEQGSGKFGCPEEADVFVKPLQLRRPRRDVRSSSEGPESASPTSPLPRRLFVRAVIHSKTLVPVGLKREFDLDALRATIPDPLLSPRSRNFNREALLSKLGQSDGELSSHSPVDSSMTNAHDNEDGVYDVNIKVEETNTSPSLKWQRYSSKVTAVPISIPYARAQLPALAAIMMSDRVRRGDTIELALPHPRAWSETVAYVYTGEEDLLTGQVKENILYLGGKV